MTTTTEPTWLHLFVLFCAIVIFTYPCSLILASLGYLSRNDKEPWVKSILKASNKVLQAQAILFFPAWLISAAICFLLLLGWALVGGMLVITGIIETQESLINLPLIVIWVLIHIIAQIKVYLIALNQVKKEMSIPNR